MNKNRLRHIWFFVLFISLLSSGPLHNSASAQGDLTLYKLGLAAILPEAAVLLAIAIVFFTIASLLFQRRMAR